MIDQISSLKLLIKSTMFKHKNILKQTWESNDGSKRNDTDHILIDVRVGSNMIHVRSVGRFKGDNAHFLVKVKVGTRSSYQTIVRLERIQR